MHTANVFQGKAIGARFFAGFGALWLALGFYCLQMWSMDRLVLVAIGAALLLCAGEYLRRQAKHWPSIPEDGATPEDDARSQARNHTQDHAQDHARTRAFSRINIAQWIAIGLVSFGFGRFHLDAYTPSAITAIVGMHLFPLAKLFRRPQHLVNGMVLTLWASFTVLVVPMDQMQGVTALGTGTILWASAAISLATGIIDARRSPKQSGPSASAQAA